MHAQTHVEPKSYAKMLTSWQINRAVHSTSRTRDVQEMIFESVISSPVFLFPSSDQSGITSRCFDISLIFTFNPGTSTWVTKHLKTAIFPKCSVSVIRVTNLDRNYLGWKNFPRKEGCASPQIKRAVAGIFALENFFRNTPFPLPVWHATCVRAYIREASCLPFFKFNTTSNYTDFRYNSSLALIFNESISDASFVSRVQVWGICSYGSALSAWCSQRSWPRSPGRPTWIYTQDIPIKTNLQCAAEFATLSLEIRVAFERSWFETQMIWQVTPTTTADEWHRGQRANWISLPPSFALTGMEESRWKCY